MHVVQDACLKVSQYIRIMRVCIDYLDLALGMRPNSNRREFLNIKSFYSPLININYKYCSRKKKKSDDQTKGKKRQKTEILS